MSSTVPESSVGSGHSWNTASIVLVSVSAVCGASIFIWIVVTLILRVVQKRGRRYEPPFYKVDVAPMDPLQWRRSNQFLLPLHQTPPSPERRKLQKPNRQRYASESPTKHMPINSQYSNNTSQTPVRPAKLGAVAKSRPWQVPLPPRLSTPSAEPYSSNTYSAAPYPYSPDDYKHIKSQPIPKPVQPKSILRTRNRKSLSAPDLAAIVEEEESTKSDQSSQASNQSSSNSTNDTYVNVTSPITGKCGPIPPHEFILPIDPTRPYWERHVSSPRQGQQEQDQHMQLKTPSTQSAFEPTSLQRTFSWSSDSHYQETIYAPTAPLTPDARHKTPPLPRKSSQRMPSQQTTATWANLAQKNTLSPISPLDTPVRMWMGRVSELEGREVRR